MWLEEQEVVDSDKETFLRQTNHFLAYLTFSSADFRTALQNPVLLQRALRAYRRFLRSSMNYDSRMVERALQSVDHFCDFNELSVASSTPSKSEKRQGRRPIAEVQRAKLSLVRQNSNKPD
jgi:hypothetical protein